VGGVGLLVRPGRYLYDRGSYAFGLRVVEQLASLQAALAGRYAIERDVGRGGMATVYLADDLKHHRRVAIKVLRPDLAAVLGTERFLKEIDTVAQLNHPHILPLHDSGESGGFLYFVMPFVEGPSLRARLVGGRRLAVDEALAIAGSVADALSYAHRMGVLHRDVKPENILFSQQHPVVADFGLARAISTVGRANLTRTGLAVGTPGYMSPEQAGALTEVDARSDVYSLAIVIYEMLVGEVPGSWPMEDVASPGRFLRIPAYHRSCLTEAGCSVESALVRALAIRCDERTPTPSALVAELTAPSVAPRLSEEQVIAHPAARPPGESARATGTAPQRNRWLGGPTILFFERIIEGEIAETGYQVLVNEIREAFDTPGQVSQLGRSFTWAVSFGGPPWRDLGVSFTLRGGYTQITLRENLLQLLIPIVGFGAAAVTIGMSSIVETFRGAFDLSSMGWYIAPLAWVGVVVAVARITYQYISKRRGSQLAELADRLATRAQELVLRPAAPTRLESLES
jgi:serine/threonine protein kinase